uniref:Uncharacterized protein n=1 Tax=Macaca fascicularis TaxID=9541 RepID=A0A7N9D1L2_MACFA
MMSAHCNLRLLGSSNSPASASRVGKITGARPNTWIIFVFLVKTGFHHVGQAGLKLLTSGDPPALASQSAGIAGITGVSHRAQSPFFFFFFFGTEVRLYLKNKKQRTKKTSPEIFLVMSGKSHTNTDTFYLIISFVILYSRETI